MIAVTVLSRTGPRHCCIIAGIVKLGAIAAVINTKQRGRTLQHSLAVAKARLHVVGEELWDAFVEVRDAIGASATANAAWVRETDAAKAPTTGLEAAPAVATASPATPAALADVRLGDPCFYIYTSGTTGLPKASIMSHNRWIKAAGAFGMSALALTESDVLYLALPLYHNNALTVAWASATSGGAAIAIRRKFSVTELLG